MALAYNKYFDTIPSSYKVIGAVPIDLRQVVDDLTNLYGETSEADHTWEDDKGNIIAYNGMLVAVSSIHKVYMCIDYAHPYIQESWQCVSVQSDENVTSIKGLISDYISITTNSSVGDVEIGADISIGDFFSEDDGIAVVSDIKEYLNENYATIDFVNSSILSIKDYIDSSVEQVLEQIEDLNTSINEKINEIDSSLQYTFEQIDDISNAIDNINYTLENNVVNSIQTDNLDYVHIDPSKGDVYINFDIIDSSIPEFQNIENNGIATVGLVEEKLDRFNWVEIEDFEHPSQQLIESGTVSVTNNVELEIPENFNSSSFEIVSENGIITIY